MSKVIVDGVYLHVKTNKHYVVVGVAIDSENGASGDRLIVVYRQLNHAQWYARPLAEFMETPGGVERFKFLHMKE